MAFPKNVYGFTSLIGGGQGALDRAEIDGADLDDQDIAIGIVAGKVHQYWLDEDSGLAESPPDIIAPDLNAGDKRWILSSISKLTGDLDAANHSINNVLGMKFKAATELTIAAGVITVTQSIHTVDTQDDDPSGDLVTINGGATVQLIILRAANDARTIVIKHSTGNIWLKGKADLSLDDLEDGLALFWDGTKWIDIGAGGGGDYEEGTWTPVLEFSEASVGMTYVTQAGLYTKIGRMVTVTGYILLSSKGTSIGSAKIRTLPFTSKNVDAGYSSISLHLANVTFANIIQCFISKNDIAITLQELSEAGVATTLNNDNFANNSSIMICATYFTD